MIIETLSTFPDMYDSVMGTSMMRIAQEKGILTFKAYDLRDWTHDKHRTTDDEPYGGGAGLVMKCEPIFEAVEAISGYTFKFSDASGTPSRSDAPQACEDDFGEVGTSRPYIIFLSPTGRRFDDALAAELADKGRLLFVCGHYEGIDERAFALADEVISLGDYVLTSGELASMVVIDAVVRKLPGVLGADEGALDESFVDGLLEYPQYTRPANFRGAEVPDVLLSGNHAAIARWRREQSLERTARLRPDLLQSPNLLLSADDRDFLQSLSSDDEA